MPDPLNTDLPGAPPPPPTGKRFKCVYCDCVMTGDGESIWSMGERAKTFEKLRATIEKKDEEIARLTQEISVLKTEVQTLRGAPAAARRSNALVTNR